MSREIKFRAWDEFYRKFVFHGDGLEDMEAFWRIVKHGSEARRDVPIMQFTGLHDKNGKEIYEGDIVREGNRVMAVEWKAGPAPWEPTLNYYDDPEDFEVIGNIYENPQLLK